MSGTVGGLAIKPYPEDEVRPDFDLPRVVCEYEDIFPDELPGLPPQRDVDFCIELHPGTSPISMTRIRWPQLSCMNSRSRYRSCWTNGLLDQALHHEALRFYLQRRKTRPFDCALITDS